MKYFFTIFILLTITQAAIPSTKTTPDTKTTPGTKITPSTNTKPEYHPSETPCLNLSCICRVLDSIYPTDAEFDMQHISDIDLICPDYMAAVGEPCKQLDGLVPVDYDDSGEPLIDYASFCA